MNVKPMKSSLRMLVTPLILLIAVVGTYGNTLVNGFVWDDTIYTAENPAYARFDLHRIFTTLANGVEYLPVRDVSYALDHLLWGSNPAGFHAANVFYYWLTVLAVYALARATALLLAVNRDDAAGRRAGATGMATALLFAVHPIHSEVVSFITCRNAILSALLFFLAGALFLRFLTAPPVDRRRFLAYGGALVCYCGSLLSKASGIILPLVLASYAAFVQGRRRAATLVSLTPFFALAMAAYVVFTKIAAFAHIIRTPTGIPDIGRWQDLAVKALHITGFYLGKMLVPRGLSAEYDLFTGRQPQPAVAAAVLAGLLVAVAAAVRMRRTRPCLLFSIGWYLLTLIPVLNFFPTHPVIADRYALLPSFAFFFLLASALVEVSASVRPSRVICGTAILACCWSALTVARNRVWYSEETLWKDTISVSPGSYKAYTNLGRVYFAADHNDDRAFALFDQARQINPGDPNYDYFQGYRCYLRNDTPCAIRNLNQALGRDIEFIEALYLLGVIYELQHDREKAAQYFRLVVSSREPDTDGFKQEAVRRLGSME